MSEENPFEDMDEEAGDNAVCLLAPRVPTQAMVEAGKDERMECFKSTALSVDEALSRIYGAMLEAYKE